VSLPYFYAAIRARYAYLYGVESATRARRSFRKSERDARTGTHVRASSLRPPRPPSSPSAGTHVRRRAALLSSDAREGSLTRFLLRRWYSRGHCLWSFRFNNARAACFYASVFARRQIYALHSSTYIDFSAGSLSLSLSLPSILRGLRPDGFNRRGLRRKIMPFHGG